MLLAALLAVVGLVAFLLRRRAPRQLRLLNGRYAPAVVGLVWALFPMLGWGGLNPMPADHDEASYALQAQIFASGRWAADPPPIPDLFAQPHVLVTPVLASKYPPGHALLLALGALGGVPALIVFLLNALRAGMVFALARRLTDGGTALLTVVLLYLGNDQVRFSSSYYSEVTTGAVLVAAWYCLWRWHESRRRAWLLGVALLLGWCAITRPWSAIAFALPIGFVVVRHVMRDRRWRDLGVAMALGGCVVAILPLWAWGTMGDWRQAPLTTYARDYMPFDFPHFGTVAAKPRLTPPPELAAINVSLREAERRHTLANIGVDALARARSYWSNAWPEPRLLAAAMVVVGLVMLPAAAWVGVATLVLTFAVYLAHPTWPEWTVYYFEVTPVLAVLAALGFTTILRALTGEARWRGAYTPAPRATLASVVAAVLLLPMMVQHAADARRWVRAETIGRRDFRERVARLPYKPVIVFVRYGRNHAVHRSLVVNSPDWPASPAWVVHELEPYGARLLALAPDRQGFLYDETSDEFYIIPRTATPAGAPPPPPSAR